MKKGKVTITRVNSNQREPYISIQLRDVSSPRKVVTIEMEVTDFANALFASADNPCEYTMPPAIQIAKP